MNKISKIMLPFATIGALAGPVVGVISCNNKGGLEITSKAANPSFVGTKVTGKKLAAVVSDPENPRWQNAKTYLKENAEHAGFTTKVNIAKDSSAQKTWLDTNKDADAWIIGASDDSVAGAFTGRTKSQPIVAYDRLIHSNKNSAYNWYVTYDNSRVGAFQGLSILGKLYNKDFITGHESDTLSNLKKAAVAYAKSNTLASKKSVLALGGDPADNNAGLFYDGGMNIIKAVSVVDSNLVVPAAFTTFKGVAQAKWDYAAGQTFLNGQLAKMSKTDRSEVAGVLSPNDGMATSIINALKSNGMNAKDIYITGQDSNDTAITSLYLGTGQDMTIYKPDTILSAVAVSLAKYLIANDAKNDVPSKITATFKSDILGAIKTDFGTIPMTYDGSQYASAANQPVNTILLAPQIVKKDNLSTYFNVVKK